jgi:uncharacterized SAM-binding protein YcdF (DUF218 family)
LSNVSNEKRPARRRVWLVPTLFFLCLIVVYFVWTSIRIVSQANGDPRHVADAIVVFGAAEYSGRPSPVLRKRLDHGYELFQAGLAPIVITTGGFGSDPEFSEGGVGHDYLHRRGIPEVNLIAETQGSDTAQSASRVAGILRRNNMHTVIAVSDAYHIFRVKRLMTAEGFQVYGSPRPDSRPRSKWGRVGGLLRECVSYALWKLHLTQSHRYSSEF